MIEVANDWVEKYKPKTRSEIIGNETTIATITEWLNEYNTNKEKFLKEKIKKDDKKAKKVKKAKKKKLKFLTKKKL